MRAVGGQLPHDPVVPAPAGSVRISGAAPRHWSRRPASHLIARFGGQQRGRAADDPPVRRCHTRGPGGSSLQDVVRAADVDRPVGGDHRSRRCRRRCGNDQGRVSPRPTTPGVAQVGASWATASRPAPPARWSGCRRRWTRAWRSVDDRDGQGTDGGDRCGEGRPAPRAHAPSLQRRRPDEAVREMPRIDLGQPTQFPLQAPASVRFEVVGLAARWSVGARNDARRWRALRRQGHGLAGPLLPSARAGGPLAVTLLMVAVEVTQPARRSHRASGGRHRRTLRAVLLRPPVLALLPDTMLPSRLPLYA